MQVNIIEQISNSCGCSHMGAQEYLDSEIRYLCESQEADDLREDDIEMACSSLGLDLDNQGYFISRLVGAQIPIAMACFHNTHSLTNLKKEYRHLALQYHPDKGSNTAIVRQVNTEFERFFEVWKDKPDVFAALTGYEHDYLGATAEEYTKYVYNGYRWEDRDCKGQHAPETVELVRIQLKETYPRYKFSVRRKNYNFIYVKLMSTNFEAFAGGSGRVQDHINHYNIERSLDLTDRIKEVMLNVCDFVMSCNFDNSDAVTDYFHTDFYLTLAIGSYRKPYRVELPKLGCKGRNKPEMSKHSEGPVCKAIRQALGTAYFDFIEHRRHSDEMILEGGRYGSHGRHYFQPKGYSSARLAQKRIDKLEKTSIRCKPTRYNDGYIRFIGYTPEAEALLEEERREYIIAHR